jgi:hypothetical protein
MIVLEKQKLNVNVLDKGKLNVNDCVRERESFIKVLKELLA